MIINENIRLSSIESVCGDIISLNENAFDIVLSTEAIDIRKGIKIFVDKIIEKIKWLLEQIVKFFQVIGNYFNNKWHKYVVNNSSEIAQEIRRKCLKMKMYDFLYEGDYSYLNSIHHSYVGNAWYEKNKTRIHSVLHKVYYILLQCESASHENVSNAINSINELQQEVTFLIKQADDLNSVDKAEEDHYKLVLEILSAYRSMDKNTNIINSTLEKIKDGLELTKKNLEKTVQGRESDDSAPEEDDKSTKISLFSKISSVLAGLMNLLTSKLGLIKGVFNFDKLLKRIITTEDKISIHDNPTPKGFHYARLDPEKS
jgi:hypothetical protein